MRSSGEIENATFTGEKAKISRLKRRFKDSYDGDKIE